MDSAKTLWYWDRVSPVLTQLATAPQMGINSFTLPAHAVYYNNAYWFIKEGGPAVTTQTLIQIVLSYNVNQDPAYASTNTYTFNIVDSNNQPTAVAVSPKRGESEKGRRESERKHKKEAATTDVFCISLPREKKKISPASATSRSPTAFCIWLLPAECFTRLL